MVQQLGSGTITDGRENTNWIGSDFKLHGSGGYRMNGAVANSTHPLSIFMREWFGRMILASYWAREENVITNSSYEVIAYWRVVGLKEKVGTVAVYEHHYREGTVIHTGVFGSEIITDPQMQFFLQAAVGIPPCQIALASEIEIVLYSTCRVSTNSGPTTPIQALSERHYVRFLETLVVILSVTNIYLVWIVRRRKH